jgi:hypothetical protein
MLHKNRFSRQAKPDDKILTKHISFRDHFELEGLS